LSGRDRGCKWVVGSVCTLIAVTRPGTLNTYGGSTGLLCSFYSTGPLVILRHPGGSAGAGCPPIVVVPPRQYRPQEPNKQLNCLTRIHNLSSIGHNEVPISHCPHRHPQRQQNVRHGCDTATASWPTFSYLSGLWGTRLCHGSQLPLENRSTSWAIFDEVPVIWRQE
jgi:hypothetical protein